MQIKERIHSSDNIEEIVLRIEENNKVLIQVLDLKEKIQDQNFLVDDGRGNVKRYYNKKGVSELESQIQDCFVLNQHRYNIHLQILYFQ
jgi:hypothetical protein